jgi:hypothetical protein
LNTFSAQGLISDGLTRAMPSVYLVTAHKPDKSGLPSAVLGAGAARFGLPSGSRGTPGVE